MSQTLIGRRVLLRPLVVGDFSKWADVRTESHDWLRVWEPLPVADPDPASDKSAFALRCAARDRDWLAGVGYGFGVFVGDEFAGEININSVQRGPFQSCQVGYWISEKHAGKGYVPEGLVLVIDYVFSKLKLHRAEVAIVPRNVASLRVVEKLGLRNEGTARRFLEINGVWEDHVRFAVTEEDWAVMAKGLFEAWID